MNKSVTYTGLALYGAFWLSVLFLLTSGRSAIITEHLNSIIFIVLFFGIAIALFNATSFINQFKSFKLVDSLILASASVLLLITAYLWEDNLFGIITTLTGLLCVVQAARGNIWTYYWGLANTLMYAIVAYYSDYAGDFVLNILFYMPMQFIGLYLWSRHYDVAQEVVQVKVFTLAQWGILLVVLAIGTFGIGHFMPFLNQLLGMDSNPLPTIDATTTTASVIAQILMAKRFREQWALWIGINVLSIVMWVVKDDSTMVIMWSAYLINSLFGYYEWSKQNKLQGKVSYES